MRKGYKNLTWRPKGVVDAIDGTNAAPGSMACLANLIPDPSTASVFVPRPGVVSLTGSVVGSGYVPVFLILGAWLYGMVTIGAYDVPFAYNLETQQQIYPIDGAKPAQNCPLAQPTVGDWTPPTIDTIGIYVVVSHPGFTGAANGFFGWFDVTKPDAPVWHSGNLTPNPLISPATSVRIFGGRAYYAVGNAVQASDVFEPLMQTNAGQVLTCGDSSPIIATKGLPLNNTAGGIIQALICFKKNGVIYQIAGDYSSTSNPWTLNSLNVEVVMLSPNGIASTPAGLAFVATDGVRIIDFNANVSDPIGDNGSGILVPFQQAVSPSRTVAAFNMNVLRIAVRQSAEVSASTQEYWYHFGQQSWTGPHNLQTIFMQPYLNSFIVSLNVRLVPQYLTLDSPIYGYLDFDFLA